LQLPNLLIYFDSSKPLVLACDALPVGVGAGAILSDRLEHRTEKPISYVSRTLASTERRYL